MIFVLHALFSSPLFLAPHILLFSLTFHIPFPFISIKNRKKKLKKRNIQFFRFDCVVSPQTWLIGKGKKIKELKEILRLRFDIKSPLSPITHIWGYEGF